MEDEFGRTEFDLAVEMGCDDALELDKFAGIGTNTIRMPGKKQVSGIRRAVELRNLAAARILKRRQVAESPDALAADVVPAVAATGDIDLLREFVSAGFAIDGVGFCDRTTALHVCAARDDVEMMRVAVDELGADLCVLNMTHRTPMDVAILNKSSACIEYILTKKTAENASRIQYLSRNCIENHFNLLKLCIHTADYCNLAGLLMHMAEDENRAIDTTMCTDLLRTVVYDFRDRMIEVLLEYLVNARNVPSDVVEEIVEELREYDTPGSDRAMQKVIDYYRYHV